MKKDTKIFALLMAIILIIVAFAGCKSETPGESNGSTTSETPIVTADYDGYVLTFAGGTYLPDPNQDSQLISQWRDELIELEDRINCRFEMLPDVETKSENLLTKGMAGEKIADVIRSRQTEFFASALQGYLLPVDGDELIGYGLDCFDETRWVQKQGVLANVLKGHAWSLQVASQYVTILSGYFVVFNKAMCAEAGYPDMYQLVRDHKWNWETYLNITSLSAQDTDADGVIDRWGSAATAFGDEILSNNAAYLKVEADGRYVQQFDAPATLEGLQFLVDQCYTTDRHIGSSTEARQAFSDGYATFNFTTVGGIEPGSIIAESLHDYGAIPMPMGPRATEYVSVARDRDSIVFQSCNKDLGTVIPILNDWALVFNNDGWKERLDDGRFRTEADKEMFFDYIMPNFIVQEAKMVDSVWQYCSGIAGLVSYYGESPATAAEDYKGEFQNALDEFLEQ